MCGWRVIVRVSVEIAATMDPFPKRSCMDDLGSKQVPTRVCVISRVTGALDLATESIWMDPQ